MDSIKTAATLIAQGEIAAFPTETVYGLGANALDAAAVAKIFKAKGRPADNPLIVHVADEAMLAKVAKRITPVQRKLMEKFWPGPLTILFEKNDAVPDIVTAGLSRVAVRMPEHPIALSLIKEAGVPIAAPSANKSGRPSPTTAAHVLEDHPGMVVVDGGETGQGLESTVVAVDEEPRILRLGAITVEKLQEVIPGISINNKSSVPESPGQKYRHYAPDLPLRLFEHDQLDQMKRCAKKGTTVLCKNQFAAEFPDAKVIELGNTDEKMAHNIFAALRTPKEGTILVLGVPKKGIGRTIMDRLERAQNTQEQ